MKRLTPLFAAIVVCCSPSCSQATHTRVAESASPSDYAELLKTYVTPEGVRYAAWHANKADVDRMKKVAEFFASTTPPADRDASLAWHINAYNAWILNNILKKYPTKGPLDGETLFFHGNRIVVSGEKTSFNNIEQKVIRPVFKDPRVHFALNCASESCPPLQNKPFAAASLDSDLERLARAFINGNPHGVMLVPNAKTVKLSKIFEWYADDFGGKGNQLKFINRYRQQPVPADARIEFFDYSWNLNQAR